MKIRALRIVKLLKEIGEFVLIPQRKSNGEFQVLGAVLASERSQAGDGCGDVAAESLCGGILRARNEGNGKSCPKEDSNQPPKWSDLAQRLHATSG